MPVQHQLNRSHRNPTPDVHSPFTDVRNRESAEVPVSDGRRGNAIRAVVGAALLIVFSIGTIGAVGSALHASTRATDEIGVFAQSAELVRYMPDIRTSGYVSPTLTPTPTPTVTITPTPTVALPGPRRAFRSMPEPGRERVDRLKAALAPAGISGFGESIVAVQNLTDGANAVDLTISQRGRNRLEFDHSLAARGAHTVSLDARPGTPPGFWHGVLRPAAAADAVVRSTWPLSATSAYLALAPADNFFLPLAVRGLDRHFFTYYLQNADEVLENNVVTFQVFDAEGGGIVYEWEEHLEPGQVVDVDSIESTTGPFLIPSNARDGGWIGGIRIRAEGDIALLTYGNEARHGGVAAYGAQPVEHASEVVHLPLIRANVFGDSLIAVGNPGTEPIEARLIYRGASESPSGAGETFEQAFTINPRTSRFVDLGEREWGTVGSHPVPTGSRPHGGFVGSARIESDGGVVATVLETALYMTATRATAAYDGFTESDLGTAFAVPYLVHVPGGVSTRFIALNPGDAPVTVSVEWDLDQPAPEMPPSESVLVPAGEVRMIKTTGAAAFAGRATLSASGPVAMLVYESPFETAADFSPVGDMGYDTAAYAPSRLVGDVGPPASPTPDPTTAAPTPTPRGPGTVWTIHMPVVMKAYTSPGRR